MDIAVLILTIPAFVMTLSTAFGAGADSPSSELRWSGLEPADRDRISAAARSHTELDDPEEAELAAGFNRRRLRRSSYVEAPVFFLVAGFTALSLAGLHGGLAGSVLAVALVLSGLWRLFGEKRLDGMPRAATTPDAGHQRSSRAISAIVCSGRSRRSSQPSRGRW